MKQILPILTLTTLTAAAFANAGAAAPAAAASGLSYNRVGISREGQNTNLSVAQLLGSSNVLVELSTRSYVTNQYGLYTDDGNYTFISVGYVFKNVAAGVDATVYLGAGDENTNSAIGVNLRRSLSEVLSGLEIAVGYEDRSGAGSAADESAWTYELAYNINKQFSIAYGVIDIKSEDDNRNVVSLRYNY
jgi:hypothetical protein